nr:hypothetical protein [Tanacetum cinerariifolium]
MDWKFQLDKFLIQKVPYHLRLLPMQKYPSKKWINTLKNGTMEHLGQEVLKLLMDWKPSRHNLIVLEEKSKRQMSNVLQERGFRNLPSSTEANPKDHVNLISTIVEADTNPIRHMGASQYTASRSQNNLGASISVMPLSTYLSLGLGELGHTKSTVELAYRTMKYPKGITKNVLVGIGKKNFLVDFIILDMPEDVKVPLILRRPFLSTAHAKIDVFKRNITLRVGDEKTIFKSVKPTSSLIKRVYMLCLRVKNKQEKDKIGTKPNKNRKQSNEFIKSCVENLVPNLSESEGESGCDVLACFTTFSNVLFDDDYDSDSSDNQSLSDEDVSEKIYLNPLFDEEIIPIEIDQHSFNVASDLIESLPNHDSSVIISSKIDSLFDEFAGEEIVSNNSNADIESFSPSPIPNKDSDSHMEEIDLYLNLKDPMPPGIEEDDDDSERDISILEELLDSYSLSLPANELYHFDIPSPYRPPAKPPDGNTGTLNIKMLGDVSDQKVPIPNHTITRIFNQEKSPDLFSYLGFEAFQPSAECPMIINGKNIPLLDVPLFHFYPLDQLKYGGN